jgi:hypothetical protein
VGIPWTSFGLQNARTVASDWWISADAHRLRASCLPGIPRRMRAGRHSGREPALTACYLRALGLCDQTGFAPLPASSSIPPLHPASGLRPRFRRSFPVFCARASSFPTLTTYGFSTFCCRPRPRLRASCLPGIPRRTSRGRPKTQDHRHSEGIICWASCWIIRRATSSFFSLMVISSSSSLYS